MLLTEQLFHKKIIIVKNKKIFKNHTLLKKSVSTTIHGFDIKKALQLLLKKILFSVFDQQN